MDKIIGIDNNIPIYEKIILSLGTGLSTFYYIVIKKGTLIPMSVDYSEWKFGINNAGFLGSISNFTQILSTAIGNGIIGWLLNYVKYEPNVTQTNSTLTGLKLTISIIPAIIFALGLVIHLWDLDQNKHKKIISDLQIYYEKKNS